MSQQQTKKSLKRFAVPILFNLVAVGLILGAVEFAAMQKNIKAKQKRHFMINREKLRALNNFENLKARANFLDPHLGYAYNPAIEIHSNPDGRQPGFVYYGDPADAKALRVIALGGSTTEPSYLRNWPKPLHALLEAEGIPAVVFNGGVQGYSSNQELLKLIRDVLPLEPDIVISFSGVNDLGFMHSMSDHPMVSKYQRGIYRTLTDNVEPLFLPNTIVALRRWRSGPSGAAAGVEGIHFGTEVETTPAAQWAKNMRLMHSVSQEFGIDFACYLQPVLGSGTYKPSAEERKMFDAANESQRGAYGKWVQDFYAEARITCEKLPYATDFADVFAGEADVYRDARHPNAEGNNIIARAILEDLRQRGVLKNRQKRDKLSQR